MWGEFAFGEGFFGGTTGQFEIGFLTAEMRIYPAMIGTIAMAVALEGSIELDAALNIQNIEFSKALEASVEVAPVFEASIEVKP